MDAADRGGVKRSTRPENPTKGIVAMDDIAKYNQERWEELAKNYALFSRPALDLDPVSAREMVDAEGMMGDVRGKDVLCLASGGGQQSVAIALLGANVTVFDLSATQLQRDLEAAAHYDLHITAIQGDMRDLTTFAERSFDIVWHPYSINFVPDARVVLREVARVLRPNGLYRMMCANPFILGVGEEDWNGEAYPLTQPYADGAELILRDPTWVIEYDDETSTRIQGPREFRHTLSTVVNNLVRLGFVILGTWEHTSDEPDAEPGTWDHFKSIAPPFLTFWACYRPDVLADLDLPRA